MPSDNNSGGTKFDSGKTRIDLFPGEALFAISDILTFGAQKYADRNWEKGMMWGRVFGATMRHMWSWWQGKGPTNESFVFGSMDDETKRSHLWHAGCCIVFLITYEMRGVGTDDRPNRATEEKDVEQHTSEKPTAGVKSPDPVVNGGVSDLQADLRAGRVYEHADGVYRDATYRRVVRYDSAGNRLDGLPAKGRIHN